MLTLYTINHVAAKIRTEIGANISNAQIKIVLPIPPLPLRNTEKFVPSIAENTKTREVTRSPSK